MGYSKLLRLASPNDSALGQLVTFCTGDLERINEAVVAGVLFFGTPVLFILSTGYAWYLIGPLSLLGLLVILLFYPVMVRKKEFIKEVEWCVLTELMIMRGICIPKLLIFSLVIMPNWAVNTTEKKTFEALASTHFLQL